MFRQVAGRDLKRNFCSMSSRPLTLFQGPNFRRQWVKSRRSSPVESLVSRRRLYRNDFTDADKSVRPKWLLTVTLRNSAIPSRHGCFSLAAERVVHIQSARVKPSAASPWPEHANSPNQLTTTFVPYRWQIRRNTQLPIAENGWWTIQTYAENRR